MMPLNLQRNPVVGHPLPVSFQAACLLIANGPAVESEDDGAQQFLRGFVELAKRHRVVLLACHRVPERVKLPALFHRRLMEPVKHLPPVGIVDRLHEDIEELLEG